MTNRLQKRGVADERVILVVDDAPAIAEWCWDAGFEIHVRGSGDASTYVVIDPFGHEVELISRGSHHVPNENARRTSPSTSRVTSLARAVPSRSTSRT